MIIFISYKKHHLNSKLRKAMTTIKNTFSKIENMLNFATISSVVAIAYFAVTNFIA